ncbi:MAG: UDP-N-acetylglucosamine 2-epimerase (hydrolyzing) [Lachnospiraceae bacterium]|nr:UDP-N-acetylglucosamine 2-epimerase (hydrolyzing) [Lachnospiraceae bacterium]
MKTIAVPTATRAEYGQLIPLIKRIAADDELDLDLIVTGTHLSNKHGHTIDLIREDGFDIAHEIPILDDDNGPLGVSLTMSNALRGFAECFHEDRPDLVVILGDRTEMLPVACAALNERIPAAHIHGGEVTAGAVDESIRHAITKMSHLHFASTERYRQRIIQLGEAPEHVYNVGALSVENIRSAKLIGAEEVRSDIGIPAGMPFAVVTFHPVTMEGDTVKGQIDELCAAMREYGDIFFLITGSNADAGGDTANTLLRSFADDSPNAMFVQNLGMRRYLSAAGSAAFLIGNSSSGILEGPALGTPSVNIGDRQKGRIMAKTVVSCPAVAGAIKEAIGKAFSMEHIPSDLFGDGHTSEKIVNIIKQNLADGITMKKGFYDLEGIR